MVRYMSDNITRILLNGEEKKSINNYGIYDYFRYSDNVQPSKMVSTLIDNNYIITYSKDDNCYHYDLQQIISDKFGDFDFSIIAYANDLLIWKEEDGDFTDDEIDVIVGIIDEVEKYIYDTGIVKNMGVSSNNLNLNCYGNDLNSYSELKKKLNSFRNEKTKLVTK